MLIPSEDAVDELVQWWKKEYTNYSYKGHQVIHQVIHIVVKIEYIKEGWRGIFSETYTYNGKDEKGEHDWFSPE